MIIADYNLPGPNGLEVIARIEAASARKVPAIFLTGDISASTLLEIAAKGHVHLYKPANPRTLIRHINAILDNSGRSDLPSDDDGKVHVSNTKAAPLDNGSQKALASTVFVVGASSKVIHEHAAPPRCPIVAARPFAMTAGVFSIDQRVIRLGTFRLYEFSIPIP